MELLQWRHCCCCHLQAEIQCLAPQIDRLLPLELDAPAVSPEVLIANSESGVSAFDWWSLGLMQEKVGKPVF